VSLASYTDLQTAVANWLARADLTAFIPDLITLAEQRIFYGSEDPDFPSPPLRIRAMETFTDPTTFLTVAGTPTLALPAGFLGHTANKVCYLNTTIIAELDFVTQRQLDLRYTPGNNQQPRAYTLQGDNLRFGPTPDLAYGVVLGYYKKFDALSVTPANWLMTNAPGVYLYATLLEASVFNRNDARLPVWAKMFAAATGALMKASTADRWSGALQAQPDHMTP
jgi:hypothetical protein